MSKKEGGAWGRRGVEPPTKFSKREGLDRTSTFRGRLVEKRKVIFFSGGRGGGRGCNFYIKDKLKSEIFNIKKI